MKTVENIKLQLNRLKEEAKTKYKAEIIGIFGSYARGEAKTTSDID
ncbi:MAG: hypothetical protein DRP54_04445 [Spirochaetes bacterium]|nr:MAG: hypothetical protein DRP54_04445 [Spirochaetota bacterium]